MILHPSDCVLKAVSYTHLDVYKRQAGYEDVVISRLKWPLSVLRLKTRNKEKIIECANHILEVWRGYSDESADILAETKGDVYKRQGKVKAAIDKERIGTNHQ